ncbi:MAG: nucleotidyltransferase substrate binding protein [Alphaproteobacteria bacterium]|nr:nucleotidyltransferase substrate binding protein [Alphaproteobacteria bacterium]
MARLDERLQLAQAALATLDELVNRDDLTLAERDGAFFRFVYTFEAIWRAAVLFLEQREGLTVRSTPKDVIRASRRAELLTDEDAEEAIRITDDRNQTVHMYHEELGELLAAQLPGYAGLLHRWLNSMLKRTEPSQAYQFFGRAIIEKKQIVCMYDGYRRELCPIMLGHSQGEEKSLTYQFGGESRSGLPRDGEWRCLFLSNVSDVQLRSGRWHTGDNHTRPSRCVEIVDLDVDPHSPYDPKRPLSVPDDRAGTTGRRSTTSTKGRRRSPRRSPAPKRRK